MQNMIFDRNEHIYTSTAFSELVKDAVRFFNGTPVHTLPPPKRLGEQAFMPSITRGSIRHIRNMPS